MKPESEKMTRMQQNNTEENNNNSNVTEVNESNNKIERLDNPITGNNNLNLARYKY